MSLLGTFATVQFSNIASNRLERCVIAAHACRALLKNECTHKVCAREYMYIYVDDKGSIDVNYEF